MFVIWVWSAVISVMEGWFLSKFLIGTTIAGSLVGNGRLHFENRLGLGVRGDRFDVGGNDKPQMFFTLRYSNIFVFLLKRKC